MLAISTMGSGLLTINVVTIDYVARTGTVDCMYSLVANSGEVIMGNYVEPFDVINEFNFQF